MRDLSAFLGPDTVAILLFHGVIRRHRPGVRNYTRKHLSVDEFAGILRDLARRGTAVAMDDVASGGALPPRAFAITFDDGFENNYSVAAPVLRDMGIPATFYVTTGFIDTNGGSWTDRIEAAIDVCEHATVSLPRIAAAFATREEKIRLLDDIRRVVKGSPDLDPYAIADDVVKQLGVGEIGLDPELDHKLTWEQVREMAGDPLFTVGGHGHTHRILSFLTEAELDSEVERSVALLGAHMGAAVEHYSYPEGLAHCYSPAVIAALKRHGVRCSPTAEEGVNRAGDDPFRLKRVWAL